MTWTVVDDVVELVDRIFRRNVPVVDAIESMVGLNDQFNQLAQAKKYWVINKALGQLEKLLNNGVSPELLQALAQHIPLEPAAIFEQMGRHPGFPEVDAALVDNLLRHERLVDEASELDYRLRQLVESGGMDTHVITILDEIVRRGDNWSFWHEPVSEVLKALIQRHGEHPDCNDSIRTWFMQNETRIVDIDDNYRVFSRWNFKDCLWLYDWGLQELGKIAMDNSAYRAVDFEFVRHDELMDENTTLCNYVALDDKTKLCFMLATARPIEPWMLVNLNFMVLHSCFDVEQAKNGVLDPDRVTFIVLEASRELDNYYGYQVIDKLLKAGYPQSSATLITFFTNIAKRHVKEPMIFCRVFENAGAHLNGLDLSDCHEWPTESLLAQALEMRYENIEMLLSHYSLGMKLPRQMVMTAVDHLYTSWPEAQQNQIRRVAPEWLLSHSERLREDKLFNDMGL